MTQNHTFGFFFSRTSTHLTLKVICYRNTANTLSDFANFHQTCFCLMSGETFALHHFWTPKNCIRKALWKQMSVYFCISSSKKFCSRDLIMKDGEMGMWDGEWVGGRLNSFLKAARCLGLIKWFIIFHVY